MPDLGEDEEEEASKWWWLAAPFVAVIWLFGMLWRLWWIFIVLIIVIGVPLAALGVFNKDPAPEIKNCAGYDFVRELEREAQIESFKSVKPESGWRCEYSLNDEEAFVRFKHRNGKLELEVEGRGSAYDGASEEAATRGYSKP